MDKFAQKRSLRSRVLETINAPGRVMESLHGEFGEVMESMRQTDEQIRTLLDGVKDVIRAAKSSSRQRDYLAAATALTDFHSSVRKTAHMLSKFNQVVDDKNYKYLFDSSDLTDHEKLLNYDPKAKFTEAAIEFDAIVKEAGLLDTVKNVYDWATDTGSNVFRSKNRARAALMKRLPGTFLTSVEIKTESLVRASQDLLRHLLSTLDRMESGLSRRNVKLYSAEAKNFIKREAAYHAIFLKYDAEVIAPLRKFFNEEKKKKEEAAKLELQEQETKEHAEAINSPLVVPTENVGSDVVEVPAPAPANPTKPPYKDITFKEFEREEIEKEKAKALSKLEDQNDYENVELSDLEGAPKAPTPLQVKPVKASHGDFIRSLTVYADKQDFGGFITHALDYSDIIDDTDPEASAQVLRLASELLDLQKRGGILDFWKPKLPEEVVGGPKAPAANQDIGKKKV